MKLKHMKVQYTHIPEAGCTLYYAFGVDPEDGKMYESHYELLDTTVRLLDRYQLEVLVTRELAAGIVEVTREELDRRNAEMRGEVYSVLSDRRGAAGSNRASVGIC